MDKQELTGRLLEIAGVKQIVKVEQIVNREPGIVLTERTCWLDGEECPYGRPEGQFLKRPRVDCKPRTEKSMGCLKLNENSEELDGLMREEVREGIEKEVFERIKKAVTKVSSELRALADRAEDSQEEEVLKLAAELIEKEEGGLEDWKIVLLGGGGLDLDIELHSG